MISVLILVQQGVAAYHGSGTKTTIGSLFARLRRAKVLYVLCIGWERRPVAQHKGVMETAWSLRASLPVVTNDVHAKDGEMSRRAGRGGEGERR